MKLTQLFLCSAALALPLTLHAATQKSDDRWFDVEIVLFSQLGDKSQLKESFPDSSELPKYPRVEDLLRRYLNPDIRGLKQLLPHCDAPLYAESLVKKQAELPALFSEKSLAELSLIASEMPESDTSPRSTAQESSHVTDPTSFSDTTNSTTTKVNTTINNDTLNNEAASSTFDSNTLSLQTELSDAERAKIQALVLAAEQAFQMVKFQYTSTAEPKLLCRLDEAYFADYKANNPNFDYYGFTVDKMPLLIDGQEVIGNNQTHLLNKDSLQLDDIIKDLRYSKNFRPLLHMGWRQVARPEKESIPVKVYAGENFAAAHQKKLARFNKQKNQHIAQALDVISEQNSVASLSVQNRAEKNQTEQLQAVQQARIQQIIAQISQVNEDTDELLTLLEAQDLSLPLNNENPLVAAPPIAPVQPWFIDGFFNIHLKHYLFITADFNILDKNLSELATAQLAATAEVSTQVNSKAKAAKLIQAKAIRFKQDRRVISGEVHYFDHPYFGMIVQIRPYTKPEQKENN